MMGVSGMIPVDQRPSGKQLIEDAPKFETVVFYKIDRLSRSLKNLLAIHDSLTEFNVTLRSATEPFDTSTSFGVFMMQLLGSMAELQRKDLLERTSQGKARAVKLGKFSGGMTPFAFDVINDKLVPNPAEATLLEVMFTKVADGMTLVKLAEYLNQQPIRSGRKYRDSSKTKLTKSWTQQHYPDY
jgi:site-specific DNA recombinase